MTAPPPLSIYVHLPWCVAKCPYCDFNSHTAGSSPEFARYVAALRRDLEAERPNGLDRRVETVFLGGGTPSLFGPPQIAAILASLGGVFDLASDAEITMEANPGTVERGDLSGYRDAGVTRLSLGVQSFAAGMLRSLGRIHGPDEALSAVEEAGRAGFDSVNVDLMFALPGQTVAAAVADVDQVIALGPEHVSYYQLTLEPNTVFFARPPARLPDDDRSFAIQRAGHERLAAAGYRQYEVSALSMPGHECRHNLNYWSFGDYLGVGAGAHGKFTDASGRIWRSRKTAHPIGYMRDMENRTGGMRRRLAPADVAFEYMLNALRLPDGFRAADFEARTGLPFTAVRASVAAACEDGLLDAVGHACWRPSELGFRFLNDLQARFLPEDPVSGADPTAAPVSVPASGVMHKAAR